MVRHVVTLTLTPGTPPEQVQALVDEIGALDDLLFTTVDALSGQDDAIELTAALVDLTLRQAVGGSDPTTSVTLALRLVPVATAAV